MQYGSVGAPVAVLGRATLAVQGRPFRDALHDHVHPAVGKFLAIGEG